MAEINQSIKKHPSPQPSPEGRGYKNEFPSPKGRGQGEGSKRFHFSILVFFGIFILCFALWLGYLKEIATTESNFGSYLILGMGLLFSAACGLFVWSLETRQEFLKGEVRRRTLQLQKTNEELAEKNKEIESFAFAISHDLKAPLVSIQGFASLLKSELGAAAAGPVNVHLDRISANVKQMSALIQDILEFSRIGRAEETEESVDLDELFKEILAGLKPQIEAKKVEIQIKSPFHRLWGPRKRLHQVFMNLIGNSVKYIGSAAKPRITVYGRESEGRLFEICVEDNGIGIPKEAQEKVFKIFQRFHPKLGVEGTGIGLSIVKKIVETNGGRISFASEPGKGTSFFIAWPKADSNGST